MTGIEFYTLSENMPFTVAIAVVTLLSLLEGVLLFVGFGLINFIDTLLPDVDMDVDGFGIEDQGLVSKTLSFLRVKKVPVVILLVSFLMSFGLSGLAMQTIIVKVIGSPVNGLLLSIPAFFIGITLMKGFGEVIAKIMPSDETDAKDIEAFTNKVGVVTLGVATKSQPAQCKIKDKTGQVHYFMVYPDLESEELKAGDKVLLVRYEQPYFYAIKPDNKNI